MNRSKKRELIERLQQGERPPSPVGGPIEGPDPAPVGLDQAALPQRAQVMANGGLILRKLGGDVAHAQRFSLLSEQIKQPKARGVAQDSEALGDRLGARQAQGRRRRGTTARIVLMPDWQGAR